MATITSESAESEDTNLWTTEKIAELIRKFEARPCLYQTNHKDYFNRDIRSKTFQEIATL